MDVNEQPKHSYDLDLFEYRFLLQHVLGAVGADQWDSAERLLQSTLDFCNSGFRESGRRADLEGCSLTADGTVIVPSDFHEWQARFKKTFFDNLSNGEAATEMHPSVRYAILELLMGANASFMTYFGFNGPSIDLITKYGGFDQDKLMIEKLRSMDWSSCLCITEDNAGSDLMQIETRGTAQSDGTYLVQGRKRLISAGMHELAENIVYFVLVRTGDALGNAGLSCIAIPRYWVDANGKLSDNNVRCIALPDKMGFRGCANTTLEYGGTGPCRGYLMGAREGTGLLQLLTLMVQARVSTGIYALGTASNAYRSAVTYARNRKQGRSFRQALNPRAEVIPIIEHPDVARMLMSMKCQIDAARALVALLGKLQADDASTETGANPLIALFTPIIKAHLSDQAWDVCTTAIQVHGGNGYLKDHGIEQAARDVKVLSIWEGTNYIQSQYLLRDALGLGLRSKARALFVEMIRESLSDDKIHPDAVGLRDELQPRLTAWEECLDQIARWTRDGQLEEVPKIAVRFQKLTSQLTFAWLLLRSASAAMSLLRDSNETLHGFLRGKIASAKYYYKEVVPEFDASAIIIMKWVPEESISADLFDY